MNTNQLTIKTLKRQVYDRIAIQDDVSKIELMKDIQVTSSSLNRILEELQHEEWIMESGFGKSTGGRKPVLYRINAINRYIFGLDISRKYSVLGLYDLHMNTLYSHRWPMDEQMTPQRLVDEVIHQVKYILAERHISRRRILGIGVGAVGPLNLAAGMIQNPDYFAAPGWENVRITQMLTEGTGIAVKLDNGINTALLGEYWIAREERRQHILYVNAGIGIRSAYLSDGRIMRGAADKEGAVGQMVVQAGGARLQDEGNYGALEAYASIQALQQQMQQLTAASAEETSDHGQQATDELITADDFETMVHRLEQKDPFMQRLFYESASYMGIGLANLINMLQPEQVILGGVLVHAAPGYYETAVAVAKKQIYGDYDTHPDFSRGKLQEQAVSVGAAVMVLEQMSM